MKTFEITEEQIKEGYNAACYKWKNKIKEWFPSVFNINIEVGKWYKTKMGSIYYINRRDGFVYYGYGFPFEGVYFKPNVKVKEYEFEELATREQVEELLINEAIKRYGRHWRELKIKTNNISYNSFDYTPVYDNCSLWNYNGVIFKNGEWAELYKETVLTKQEIADKLNIPIDELKIID